MKLLFALILTSTLINIYAIDSTLIVIKKEVYSLSETCKDSISWEEIVLKNKDIQNTINASIYKAAQKLKLGEDYIEEKCNNELKYEATSNVVYFKDNIVSILFKSQRIWPNIGYETQIRTINYNTRTGKLILFHELFKPEAIPIIDSLILVSG